MGNGKRSGEALQRRAEKKAVKVEHKNKLARLSEPNWICKAILVYGQECGNDNFARRANCNICQAPNPKPASRVLKTKAAKPVKQTNWRKNPSPADIQENIRLRSLLEEEKASGITCSELAGDVRIRADILFKKKLEQQKLIKKKNEKRKKQKEINRQKRNEASLVDADSGTQTEEKEATKVDKDEATSSGAKKKRKAVADEDSKVDAEPAVAAEETSEERAARKAAKKKRKAKEEEASQKAQKAAKKKK